MTVNVEFLNRVMKRIERDLEHWNQNSWGHVRFSSLAVLPTTTTVVNEIDNVARNWCVLDDINAPMCGTTMCLAGHAVMEAGDKLLFSNDYENSSYCIDAEGNTHHIMYRAGHLLGLTEGSPEFEIFQGNLGKGNTCDGAEQFIRFKRYVEARLDVTLD